MSAAPRRPSPAAVIAGLGFAGMTRGATAGPALLAAQAIDAALDDAGLVHADVQGLLVSRSGASPDGLPDLTLQTLAGLRTLRLLQTIDCEGTSAIQMIDTAAHAVGVFGDADHVVCVFADVPLRGGGGKDAFGKMKSTPGVQGLRYAAGAFGGASNYALSARRHMHDQGLTERHLGSVAVATRDWAARNPQAALRKPITLDDYLASRFVVEPLRLLDCAIPVNGAIAIVVSRVSAAGGLRQPPVYVQAIAQAHRGGVRHRDVVPFDSLRDTRERLFAAAGVDASVIDIREFYDAFTFMTIAALEGYGFCAPGAAGAVAASGALGPGGDLPTNTGGGHLSAHYLQGMTPISEAVLQVRGAAGERQCPRRDVVLVTNEGGWFDHHAAMIVSPHPTLS